ncbi:DUF4174 domain-containing protein [Lewinella sp. 4G2]|uniref:DUF4174 domain-containing protein n=1 Tax=Lewinella sp. 4G2 TaxID=1803372 RepID=UPI0018D4AC98|nr:DUF4174 domain-containing protein [Lewinella sp. 4G2]
MKSICLSIALLFCFSSAVEGQSLNEFQWKSRLVLLFTPDPGDPLFEEQVRLLYLQREAFEERDVKFMWITPDGKFENTGRFLDESFARQYYERFDPRQYEFTMILVGMDGNEKFRATNRLTPASVLVEMIDGMPMRQREILQGYGNKSMSGKDPSNQNRPASTRRSF